MLFLTDVVTSGDVGTKKEELALAMSTLSKVDYAKNWIVDWGCSNHMKINKEKLINIFKI